MSTTILIAVTIAYVGIGVLEVFKGNAAGGIVFGGYALANVGLIMGTLA